jgi:hypothetical protein
MVLSGATVHLGGDRELPLDAAIRRASAREPARSTAALAAAAARDYHGQA